MRWWTGLMALALAASPAMASDAEDLAGLLRANSWSVIAGETGLGGPGAAKITGWSAEAQFFLLGENHGNAGMARFATALSRSVAAQGYRYTAVEADPLMVEVTHTLLRANGKAALAAWLAEDHRQRSIPFYFWDEEADFFAASLARGPVWGLDQSFIGAAHVHLDAIANLTKNAWVRADAQALAGEARKDVFGFLGKVDPARLRVLRAMMPRDENPKAVQTLDDLIESAEIYGPFVGRGGSIYAANLRRETLMKKRFLANYRAAERRDGKPPRVLLKFGSNHLARGLSLTHVPSLGNFVAENALGMLGKPVFNLALMCGPGSMARANDNSAESCADDFEPISALKPYLAASGNTLFDLRPLRDRPRLIKDWPQEAKDLVWRYDAIVVVADAGASSFLAPAMP